MSRPGRDIGLLRTGRGPGDNAEVADQTTLNRSAGAGSRVQAVALGALSLLILIGAAVLDAIRAGVAGQTNAEFGSVTAALGTIVVGCGCLILARYRRHPVAVALLVFGFLWSVDGLLESWAALGASRPEPLPGTGFAFWFVDRIGAFLLVGLPVLLVLYPGGRLLGGVWKGISIVAIVMACTLPVALTVMPISVVYLDGGLPPPVPEPNLPTLPVSDQVGFVILVVTRAMTFLALLPTLLVIFVRHRRATGLQRTQLRWLLWAAIICAILVAVSLLVPTSLIAYIALFAAVIATSASIAAGICRPDLVDIDGLVAGTVVYAGVAGCVVILDFAVLAATSGLLGDRLDQREITLVVLLLAIAVYGPLRNWLSSLVRRVLVGRRGDRYQVVSSLAARLEASGRIEDQLPEMTSAVADAFKMSYVGVEIFASDGGTRSATFGERPATVQEFPLTYSGELVGRLTLPARGIRSMLSRRDQALLVDLVRQSAIAIRSATLATELQVSREQLVHDREDDRRRIRRDLHDGLGPALGGVALRLDAAGNALATDPERSRELISQARTEITDALADVRRLVHGLRPPALDDSVWRPRWNSRPTGSAPPS